MSFLERLLATDRSLAALVARVTVGLVMFPHGAQKLFGWFGGRGFSGAMDYFTGGLNIPAPLAVLAILTETFGSLALIVGVLTRPAALGMIGMMIGALISVPPVGFFMNWSGKQAGEGYEFHILVIGASLALILSGAGRASVDAWLARRLSAKRAPAAT